MYEKIPLYNMTDDGFVLMDGLIVKAYRFYPLNYEGVVGERHLQDIRQHENLCKMLTGCYLSYVVELSKDNRSLLDLHIRYHESNRTNRFLAKTSAREKFSERLLPTVTLVIGVPMFESRSDFGKALKKPSRITQTYQETVKRLGIISGEIKRFYRERYGICLEELLPEAMWKHLAKMVSGREKEPVLPSETNIAPPSLRSQLFFSDVKSEDLDNAELYYLRHFNRYIAVMSMNTLPGTITPGAGSYVLSGMDFPVRITCNIHVPNQQKAFKSLENMRRLTSIFVSKRKDASLESEKNHQKATCISDLFEEINRERLQVVKLSYQVVIEETDLSRLQERVEKVGNILSSAFLQGASVYLEGLEKERAYVSSLGYFPSYGFNYLWTTSLSAMSFVPLRGAFSGTMDEPLILFGNRFNSITAWHPASKRQNKNGIMVIAPSGAGKSFAVNYILSRLQSVNPITFVIDLAPQSSYHPIVREYGGEYLEVNPDIDEPKIINAFDLQFWENSPKANKIAFFENLLGSMLAEGTEGLGIEEYNIVRKAVNRTYARLLSEAPRPILQEEMEGTVLQGHPATREYPTYISLRNALLEKAKEEGRLSDDDLACIQVANRLAMPTFLDLVETLSMDEYVRTTSRENEIADSLMGRLQYYIEGVIGRLLAGRTTLEIKNPFFVINLGYLKDTTRFLVPMYLIYKNYAWENFTLQIDDIPPEIVNIMGRDYFLGLQQRLKIIFIDEFHNLKKHPIVLNDANTLYRQGRTYGVLPGLATQSLRDVVDPEGRDAGIFDNTANKLFLRHSTEDNPQVREVEFVVNMTGMNEAEAELFRSLSRVDGEYSEIFLFSEDVGRGVVRVEPTPYEMWTFTTDKRERYLRDALIKDVQRMTGKPRDLAQSAVVKVLARTYPRGVTNLPETERQKLYRMILSRFEEMYQNS